MNDRYDFEMSYEELFQSAEFSNTDNFERLARQNKSSDIVYYNNGKVRVIKIK